MRAVEKSDFSLVIRLLGLCNKHVQTCFVGGELSLEFGDRHILRFLDNPEVEDLGLHYEVVGITDFFLNLSYIFAREAGYDTVNQGGANIVVFLEPLFEACIVSSEVVFPKFYVFADAVFEMVSVEEDEFAWHEDETFLGVTAESLIAAEE